MHLLKIIPNPSKQSTSGTELQNFFFGRGEQRGVFPRSRKRKAAAQTPGKVLLPSEH